MSGGRWCRTARCAATRGAYEYGERAINGRWRSDAPTARSEGGNVHWRRVGYPAVQSRPERALSRADYEVFELGDVALQCGGRLPDAKLAYKTYGTLNAARDNAVLLPTFYAGQHPDVEVMMAPGRAIDPQKHFIVVPNM